ncbi:hypothetical protein XENOCAPTIV_019775 [Xenoophorus captivus]|uniref:Uncharacterized protein n=1 Tax=Xenoophorus captivus TaxID=1517983 RepID=A0ABV0R198_9TELE
MEVIFHCLSEGGFHLCFLQMTWSCWPPIARTYSMHWGVITAECEAAGMRVSSSKSEAMVLNWKRVACPHPTVFLYALEKKQDTVSLHSTLIEHLQLQCLLFLSNV